MSGAHRIDLIALDIKHALIKSLNSLKICQRKYMMLKAKFLKIGRDKGFNKSSNLKIRFKLSASKFPKYKRKPKNIV